MGATKEMVEDVKTKISVPQYFYNVILPNMADYYSDYTVDFDLKPTCKCCLHDEDTPSFRYYPETNTWSCFGCKKGGDVINLHRLFTEKISGRKPLFDEAVNTLYNYFIAGRESTKVVTTKKLIQEEELSTEKELYRFRLYVGRLEGQLLVDNTVSESSKRKLWADMDSMQVLVSLNKINAIVAMEYLKSIVYDITVKA